MITDLLHPAVAEDVRNIADTALPWEGLRRSTVLVTGASGMVASYLVYTLLHLNDTKGLGVHVVALVRDPGKCRALGEQFAGRGDVVLLQQDVCTPVQYAGAVDYIIHAASPASPRYFAADPVGTINANVLGTANLLEFARQRGVKKFLFLSSAEIYGKVPAEGLIGEEVSGLVDSSLVRSCYPESKRLSETYCAAYRKQYGLCCHAVRMAHLYGPSLGRSDGHVIAEFMRNAVDGENITLKSDGLLERSYTYVSDVAAGLFLVLLAGQEFVYNLANEEQVISIRDLAQMILDFFPEKGLKIVYDIPPAQANTGFLSYKLGQVSSRRLRGLGWAPSVPLREGLRKTLSVYQQQ